MHETLKDLDEACAEQVQSVDTNLHFLKILLFSVLHRYLFLYLPCPALLTTHNANIRAPG